MRSDAAQAPGSRAGADPAVIAAVALGWEVADLYADVRAHREGSLAQGKGGLAQGDGGLAQGEAGLAQGEAGLAQGEAGLAQGEGSLAAPDREPGPQAEADALPATLPAIDGLGPAERAAAGIAGATRLIHAALQDHPEVAARLDLWLAPLAEARGARRAKAVYDLHIRLVRTLGANRRALLDAYEVGRALADTGRDPADLSSLMDRLEAERLLPVEGRLADLSSKLPPHSAAAVAATLDQWRAWTTEARARENMTGVRSALTRQSELWRALLSGEKEAVEMLDPDMLVAASVRHASRLGTMIRGLAGAYLPALALLGLTSALVLFVIVQASGIATVVAALGALVASLLVIRSGLSLTVEATVAELRERLWGGEIDAAVAHSILRLPPPAPAARRPKLTLARPAVDAERPTLTQRVERTLHVTRSAKQQGLRVPAAGPDSTVSAPADQGSSANGQPSD